MTKLQAITALDYGIKVRHDRFSEGEWMQLAPDGNYQFSNGTKITPSAFWLIRNGSRWQYDWHLITNAFKNKGG